MIPADQLHAFFGHMEKEAGIGSSLASGAKKAWGATKRFAADPGSGIGRGLARVGKNVTSVGKETGKQLASVASPRAWAKGLSEHTAPLRPGSGLSKFERGFGALGTALTVHDAYQNATQKRDPETGRAIGKGERIGKTFGSLAGALPMAASASPGLGLVGSQVAGMAAGSIASSVAGRLGRYTDNRLAARKQAHPAVASGGSPAASGV